MSDNQRLYANCDKCGEIGTLYRYAGWVCASCIPHNVGTKSYLQSDSPKESMWTMAKYEAVKEAENILKHGNKGDKD